MDNFGSTLSFLLLIVFAAAGFVAVVFYFTGEYIGDGAWDCVKVEIIKGSAECVTYQRTQK